MRKAIIILTQLLIYITTANVLINFAIDYKSFSSTIWFSLLIISSIADFILIKTIGKNIITIFDNRLFNTCVNSLLLGLVILMYIKNKDHLSVFYLIIFGLHLSNQIFSSIKEKPPAEDKSKKSVTN